MVVDDMSLSTGYATALAGVPRVTIQRTGLFPGSAPKNKTHQHSLKVVSRDVRDLPDVTFMGLPQPQTMFDLFKAVAYIVLSSRDQASYRKDSGALQEVLKTFAYLEPKSENKHE